MVKTSYNLKGNNTLKVIGLSDIHLGSQECNIDFLEFFFDTLDKIQTDYRLYLTGDLLESASLKVGNSAFHSEMTLDEQLDQIINYLRPYKRNIICALPGNHEARLHKEFDLNLMQIIARALKVPTAPTILDTFNINGEPFTVYAKHGKGSSSMAHLQQGKALRENSHITADLFLEGHSHRLDFFTQVLLTPEGLNRRFYAFNGAFLKYKNSYAQNMYLPILPEAFQILRISKDRVVRNTPYYIDQVAPQMLEL